MAEALLRVSHLTKAFSLSRHEALRAVSDVSFSLAPGEIFGLVGESGSGKSTLARTISGLYRPTAGQVFLEELEISRPKVYARHRKHIAHTLQFLFQDSMASLNPRLSIGALIEEPLAIHREGTRQSRRETALRLMAQVGLDAALYDQYPAEFSGGMRQRVCIAIALACDPSIIIADEPTTALDVTIQAQILDLLRNLKARVGSSIILVTHDLGVIAEMADEVVVMYAGRVVERGTVQEIFASPAHPYTIGLMASRPTVGQEVDRLYSIPGKVPNPINMPDYCYFKDRCDKCVAACDGDYPHMISLSPTHQVCCYRYYDRTEVAK